MQQQEFYLHDFNGLLEKYNEVCSWFSSMGFKYASTRYGIYQKNLQKMNSWSKGENIFDLVEDENKIPLIKSLLNSHIEANEIIRVYNDLSVLNDQEFQDQINKVISGQEYRGLVDNDQARDFLFELSTASRFIRAGYNVSLKGICDIVVELPDGKSLFVECKRIKSIKKLAKNIKIANQQIDRRIKDSGSLKNIGLVAINITDLLPEISLMPLDNIQSVITFHRGVAKKFAFDNAESFGSGKKNKIIGVISESSISKLITTGGIAYSRHTGNIPYVESDFFEELAPKLSNQDIVK
jgi:hypothetical protein